MFYYKASLSAHLLTELVIIVAISLIFKQKLFYASYTVVVSYIVTMLSSIITGIAGITLLNVNAAHEITGLFTDYRLNVFKLLMTSLLIYIYHRFIQMFRERIAAQKRRPRSLHIVNTVTILMLLIVSNIVVRYLSMNAIKLGEIPNLKAMLFIGYLFFIISLLFYLYLINLHLFNHHKMIEIKEYADTDMMTGVLNRQAGLDLLTERIKVTKKTSKPLTICFVDINNLKEVNDKYGHNEGDTLIEMVSETIKNALREFDFVCRLGGDEFLIVFNNCSLKHAKGAWKRIYDQISKLNQNPSIGFPVSVSYGFSEYNPIESLSVKDFIDQADAAMYENKKKYKELKTKAKSSNRYLNPVDVK